MRSRVELVIAVGVVGTLLVLALKRRSKDVIRFKSNYPPRSVWRYLSNLAERQFDVHIDGLVPVKRRYGSVEALFQGLKFTLTDEFAEGGLLAGDAGVTTMVACGKTSFSRRLPGKIKSGFGGSVALAIAHEKYAVRVTPKVGPSLLERLQAHAGLSDFEKRHPGWADKHDQALALLACQLLMYSQHARARQLLLSTGDCPLEEWADPAAKTADFWSITPDHTSGQNANGQNLMLIRTVLRECGGPFPSYCFLGTHRVEAFAMRLFVSLRPAITAEVEASEWSGHRDGRPYEEVLRVVAARLFV